MEWQTALYAFLSFFFIASMKPKVLQPPSRASSAKASRVPEVGGGPSTTIGLSGRAPFTSFQVR